MANFNQAYAVVKKNEGGYANNPNDRGGETYKGIARKMWPSWNGWIYIDSIKATKGKTAEIINREGEKNVSLQASVLAFYKQNFWDKLNLDLVNDQQIGYELFDTSVNMGTGVAAVNLQRVLNVCNRNQKDYPDLKVDGDIGNTTIGVLNNHKYPRNIWKWLNVLQGNKYFSIQEANPSQEEFNISWISRVFETV